MAHLAQKEKNALAGTSGTPDTGNKFVTDADARLSDSRTPLSHGASLHTDRTRSVWLGPGDFVLGVGAPVRGIQGGAGGYDAWALLTAVDNEISVSFLIPQDADGATNITLNLYWTQLTGAGGNVRWQVARVIRNDGDDMSTLEAAGDRGLSTIAAPAQHILKISVLGGGAAVLGTPGAMAKFRLARLGTDGADTLAGSAGVIGVRVDYTADM